MNVYLELYDESLSSGGKVAGYGKYNATITEKLSVQTTATAEATGRQILFNPATTDYANSLVLAYTGRDTSLPSSVRTWKVRTYSGASYTGTVSDGAVIFTNLPVSSVWNDKKWGTGTYSGGDGIFTSTLSSEDDFSAFKSADLKEYEHGYYAGSAPSGTGLIQSTPNASNGYFLGYLNKALSFSFEFTATQATSAKLILHLGSEVGNFTYDPTMFAITVNGTEINYGSFDVRQIGTSTADFGFTAIEISPSIDLVEGDNVITFEIFNSDKATGTFNAVGCLFDCIEFSGYSGEVGWRPKVANLAGK